MKIWLFRFYIILLHYYNSVFVRLQLLRLVSWLWFATPYISDRLWLTFLSLCPETFLWKNIRLLSSAIHQEYHQQFPKDKVKIFIRNKTFVALKVFTNYFIILFFCRYGNIIGQTIIYTCIFTAIIVFLIIDTVNSRERLMSGIGIIVLISLGWIFSKHPSHVSKS